MSDDVPTPAGGDTHGAVPAPGRERGVDADPIVDWARTGRRVRTTGIAVAVAVVLAWVLAGLLGDGLRLADLGDWVGLGLGVMVVVEVVVVGGAAVRAERRAAQRGERLGSRDVGLLPPLVRRRRRGPAGPGGGVDGSATADAGAGEEHGGDRGA